MSPEGGYRNETMNHVIIYLTSTIESEKNLYLISKNILDFMITHILSQATYDTTNGMVLSQSDTI